MGKLIVLQDSKGQFQIKGLTGITYIDISTSHGNFGMPKLSLETLDFEVHNKDEYEKMKKLEELINE